MDPAELESLRARVYGRGATEEDRRRYGEASAALAAAPADLGSPGGESSGQVAVARRRRRVLLAALPVALVVGLGVALAAQPQHRSTRSAPPPSSSVRPPQVAALAGVPLQDGDDRRLAAAFQDPGSVPAARAAEALERAAAGTVRPADATQVFRSHGSSDDGSTVGLQLPSVPLRRGDVLLLTVIARSADGVTWRVRGERPGEKATGAHDVLVARHRPDGSRVLALAVRLPTTTVVDGFTISSDAGTPLRYTFTLLRPDGSGRSFAS